MHPEPRQQSWHSRGEKSFFARHMSVQKTNWILFRPLRGPEVCDARFFSTQSLPLGGRTVRGTVRSGPGEATINHRWAGEAGSDEGAIRYPTFPCRKGALYRLSPQRGFSIAPLGKSVAPSSVTFGDSFPPRGSLWVVQPYTKKRPKSGHADGHRNRHTTGTMCYPTPKRASEQRAGPKPGGGRHPPATLCVRAFSRESLDPPPGTGREPTSQGLTCAGPNQDHLPGGHPP